MVDADSLTPAIARELLDLPATEEVRTTFLQPENHTWRITAAGNVWYLKAHTKSWYGADPTAAAGTVRHEATAHRLLAEAGLPTAHVVAACTTNHNPLGWPYLLTRALAGTSLIELLPTLATDDGDAVLRQVGRYLARMHELHYEHPGYLLDGPPTAAPAPNQYQHQIWRFERFLTDAIRTWAHDSRTVAPVVMDQVAILLADTLAKARAAFDPPRFTHGDCHANGFFLDHGDAGWSVTGVLDLEVASAACPLFDFTKLFIELAGHLAGTGYPWWEALFEGYRQPLDLELVKLLLASAGHINYTCHGDHSWHGGREQVLRRILAAATWAELFDPVAAPAHLA